MPGAPARTGRGLLVDGVSPAACSSAVPAAASAAGVGSNVPGAAALRRVARGFAGAASVGVEAPAAVGADVAFVVRRRLGAGSLVAAAASASVAASAPAGVVVAFLVRRGLAEASAFFARVREEPAAGVSAAALEARVEGLRAPARGFGAAGVDGGGSVGVSPATEALVPVVASVAAAADGAGAAGVSLTAAGASSVFALSPVPVGASVVDGVSLAAAGGDSPAVGLSPVPVAEPDDAPAVGAELVVAGTASLTNVSPAPPGAALVPVAAATEGVAEGSVAALERAERAAAPVVRAPLRLVPMRSGRVAGSAASTLLSAFFGFAVFFFCLSDFSAIGCECTVRSGQRCTPTERRVE
jgi:hypothetical protein